jgi:hypothetical protein
MNGTQVCVDAFKFKDLVEFFKGTGVETTGFTFKDWAYGQSPLATLIGICCIVLRFFDTRFAAMIAYVQNLKLKAYQKVITILTFRFNLFTNYCKIKSNV